MMNLYELEKRYEQHVNQLEHVMRFAYLDENPNKSISASSGWWRWLTKCFWG